MREETLHHEATRHSGIGRQMGNSEAQKVNSEG